MNMISLLIGFFMWFPSFSVLNIGNGTSIQVVILLAILYVLFKKNIYFLNKKVFLFFISFLVFLIFQAMTLSVFYEESSFYLKGLTFFSLCIFMIYIGFSVSKDEIKFSFFIRGFIYGGYFSALISILQWLIWNIFQADLPFISLLHNSASFSKIAEQSDVSRAFAFMPEPSLLFIHLVGLLTIVIYLKKNVFIKIFILLAIFTTSSMGIFIVLPVILLFIYYDRYKKYRKFLFPIMGVIVIAISSVIYINFGRHNEQELVNIGLSYETNIISRFQNLSTSVSFISRTNSMLNGFDMFIQRPLTGWGVQSESGKIFLYENSTIFETNIGINSFLFSIFAWFGVSSFLILYPILKFLNLKINVPYLMLKKSLLLSSLLSAFVSLSYFNIYYIWFLIGLSLTSFMRYSKNIKRNVIVYGK